MTVHDAARRLPSVAGPNPDLTPADLADDIAETGRLRPDAVAIRASPSPSPPRMTGTLGRLGVPPTVEENRAGPEEVRS